MADQPACGNKAPHRPHNGFADVSPNPPRRLPWCYGAGEHAIDPEKDRRRALVGRFNFGSAVLPGMSKLVEECGEVLRIAGKLISTNGGWLHWRDPNLHTELMQEMADTYAAIEFMVEHAEEIDAARFRERVLDKTKLFETWHDHVDLPPGMDEVHTL
jgi:hypothetical protein